MKIVKPSVTLVWATPSPLSVIEEAGRTCYKSEPKGKPEEFVRGLIKRGHESVPEHASAGFRIICDRGVSHELVRHRIASFSQESTRYCNYSKYGIQIIHSAALTEYQRIRREEHFIRTQEIYELELAEGQTPQIARGVLPTCLKTELVMTANFREWRTILKQRTAPAAHPDMRIIAGMILQWFRINFPVIVEDITS